MQPKESKKVAKSKVKGSPDKPSEAASVGGSETVDGSVKVGESSSSSAPADDQKKCSSTPPGDSTGGSQLDTLLSEAALLMKSLRPSLKMVSLKKMEHGELATGLLDGGATNALRVGSEQELRNAIPVQVELAAGSIELYQDVQTGTLLSQQPVEPIVPVRGLISLGYRVKWDSQGCVILHPQRGRIRSWLRNGCPVVTEECALQLIADIENQERLYRMGPKLAAGKVSTPVQEWWSQRFPDVPQRIWDHMVGQDLGMPKGEGLPWNRRSRRKFDQAKGLIIHMFSGDAPSSKKWTQGWPPGVEVITVDTSTNPLQDVHKPAVWGYLCHLAATKTIIAVIGGPPCRSVSRLRNVRPGPVPLRGRYEDRFGLPGLSAADQLKADRDAALVLKQQGLLWIAEEHRALDSPPVGYLMESPEDPKVVFGEEDAPSFWSWPEVISFAEQFGLGTVSFDQGMYGHQQRKPTTCLTNLPLMGHLHGARCSTHIGEGLHENLQQRFTQTASWSSWAPGLKRAIQTSLLLLCHMHGFGNQGIKKVLDVHGWKQHIQQGHVPYRRDCRACIMDMGSGKPHR